MKNSAAVNYKARYFFSILSLILLGFSIFEIMWKKNIGFGMELGGNSLIFSVAPYVNLEIMWESRNRDVIKNINEQRGELLPLWLTPFLIIGMIMIFIGFYLMASDY